MSPLPLAIGWSDPSRRAAACVTWSRTEVRLLASFKLDRPRAHHLCARRCNVLLDAAPEGQPCGSADSKAAAITNDPRFDVEALRPPSTPLLGS